MRTYKHKWSDHDTYYINSDYGFCKVFIEYGRWTKIATLCDLIIYPEHRKNGHGQELLDEAIRFATMDDCNILVCYPDCERWTIEWYKRNGFGMDEDFGDDALVMKLK